jgi:hypothetical protein
MLLALALILQTEPAQTAPEEEANIVVVGQRLAALRVLIGKDSRGRFTCGLSASSGRAKLDASLCRTAAQCVRAGASDRAQITNCIDSRKPLLLAEVRDAR